MASGGGFGGASDTLYVDIAARFDELERQLNNIERETTSAGERAGSGFGKTFKAGLGIAAGAVVALTGAVTALVGSTVGLAAESAQNVNEFQAKLGASREEAEQLGAVAEQVFGNNFGENLAEAGEAVGLVRQQLGELSNKELQKVTEGALALKDSFGTEVSESVDATKTLMEQFGLSSQEALDFIAKGYQDGLDRSGDFLDSIGEYATQFANGGATAEEFFNLMKNGMQGGMLGTDKAADAFKEFRVRIQDGSDSTAEALESLGINSEELAKKMASGQVTAADAFKLVQSKIARVTDQNLKMQAGVALLGTQYEDLGQKGAAALSMTGKSMKDMEGATSSLSAKYDNFGALAQGMWRKVQLALLPVGKELLEMANQAVPYLSKAFERLEKTLPQMIKSGVTAAKEFGATAVNVYNSVKPAIISTIQTFQKLSAAVERNKEVLIPLAAGMTAMAATFGAYKVGIVAVTAAKAAWTVATTAATAASVALRAAIAFITGPVGLAVTAIGLLVTAGVALYRNWDEIVAWAKKTWSQITGIVQNAISGAVSYLKGINMKQVGLNIVQGLVNGILAGPKLVLAAARGLGSAVINGIKGILNIQSPSRVMQELGEFTGQGFVKGLESKVPSVKKAAQDTGKAFTDALKDLKLEHKIGGIDFSTYTKTLEQTAEQLRSKLKTVKEGTPAYSEWLSALSGVQKELDGLNKKSNETQQAAKKLADEMAKGRAEIEKYEAWKKYTKEIGNATKSQLQYALSTAKARGETEKYHAINTELERRLNKVKAAQKKQTEASKKAKEELANNRAEIEKHEAWERYIKYLKNATTAQLQKAQATAKTGGEIKKYEAIKDELTERLRKVTESQKKAEEAAEKHRESIKKNREEIEKQEAWEAWIKILRSADSTHLEEIKTTAKARGEIQKYNAVKSEQKRRTDEASRAQEEFNRQLEEGVRASEEALKSLDDLQLGGRELIAQGVEDVPDANRNFQELFNSILDLRNELSMPDVAEAWIDSINELGKRGDLTTKQIRALIKTIQDLEKKGFDPQLPDNLQGRGIQVTETSLDDPARGVLTKKQRDSLKEVLKSRQPEEIGEIYANLIAKGFKDSDLGKLLANHLENEAKAISDALDVIGGKTEDEIRGIGVRSSNAFAESFDIKNVIENLEQFANLSELDAVLDEAQLLPEQAAKIREAFVSEWEPLERWFNKTEDEIRGVGVRSSRAFVESFDIKNVIESLGQFANLSELDAVLEAAKLPKEITQQIREAFLSDWEPLTKWFNKTEDEIRGIGVATQGSAESFFDLSNAAKNAIHMIKDELAKLIKAANLTEEQSEFLWKAWGDNQEKIKNKHVETLNTWSNYTKQLIPVVTGAMTALGGTTNEVAAQWGQDLSNMTNDITSFSTAIIKGDWLGAAITGLKTLFDWFNRNKKAAEDMAKATTIYNDQFKFSSDGYGTRTVDKYTTGILFWQTDHYTEKIDEAKKNVALAIESGFVNGFSSGFNKALEQNDFSLFEKSLTESVGRSVLNGLIESFQKKAILQNIIEPAMQSYLKTGDASVFSGAISQVESVGRQFYDQVLKPIASQFGLLGSAEQTETVAKAPLPDSRISSVKVETPTVTASLNFDVLSTLATVVERAAPRIESGGQAIFEGSGRLIAAVSAIERIADKLHTRPNGDWR